VARGKQSRTDETRSGEADKMVCLGRIVAAHGVQGWVGIETYTEHAEEIAAYGPLTDEGGETDYLIADMRMGPKGILVRLEGVSDRNHAEELKGTRLYVPRAALPKIREKEAYYHADLIGLAAERTDGTAMGRIVAVQNYGAGDLLEIKVEGKADTVLVPFTKKSVPEVDMAGGRVVIDPPLGLLDPPKAEDQDGSDGSD
jgi:16S rRNA processing protein RimM